jgi:hypothetical protein
MTGKLTIKAAFSTEKFIAYDPKEEKVVIEEYPTFTMILHSKRQFSEFLPRKDLLMQEKNECINYKQRDSVNSYMKGIISQHVDIKIQEMQGFPLEEFQKTAFKIYVNINSQWLKYHLDSLPRIELSQIKKMQGARVTTLGQHTLFIHETEVDRAQCMIDFIGLCWLRDFDKNFGVKDIGRDVIVSSSGYLCFFAMELTFIYQKAFIHHPQVKCHLQDMKLPTEEHAIALIDGVDELKYASNFEQQIIPTHYVQPYATWKHFHEAQKK